MVFTGVYSPRLFDFEHRLILKVKEVKTLERKFFSFHLKISSQSPSAAYILVALILKAHREVNEQIQDKSDFRK